MMKLLSRSVSLSPQQHTRQHTGEWPLAFNTTPQCIVSNAVGQKLRPNVPRISLFHAICIYYDNVDYSLFTSDPSNKYIMDSNFANILLCHCTLPSIQSIYNQPWLHDFISATHYQYQY